MRPPMADVLAALLASRGGVVRHRILALVAGCARNPHQLSQALDLDYKTVWHHLRVLQENGILHAIAPPGTRRTYGEAVRLTPIGVLQWQRFQAVGQAQAAPVPTLSGLGVQGQARAARGRPGART